jgi:cold shock CspA family protein
MIPTSALAPGAAKLRTGVCDKWIGTIGRIIDDETSEPFFTHFQHIVPIPGRKFRALAPGQHVSFYLMPSPKGPIATEIRILSK